MQRQWSRFKCTEDKARKQLLEEISRLGGTYPIISTNKRLRRDGFPYASDKEPEDSGVAVYFFLNGKQKCMPCDAWMKIWENMRAITKTIEALRGIERWGSEQMMNQAFSAFDALPAPDGNVTEQWWDVLGVQPNCTVKEAENAYYGLAHKHHPDHGGDHVMMAKLNDAIKQARAAKGGQA